MPSQGCVNITTIHLCETLCPMPSSQVPPSHFLCVIFGCSKRSKHTAVLVFRDKLFCLSIMSARFIHVAVCVAIFSLLTSEQHFIIVLITFCFYLSLDGQFVAHVLVIANNPAVSMGTLVIL